MLYHFLAPLADKSIYFNVIRYVTFRSIAGFITALLLSFLIAPKVIAILKKKKAVEMINDVVPDSHKTKQGTPTMGGIIILSVLTFSSLLWNNLTNSYILLMLLTTFWLGFTGFIDDYFKNFTNKKDGLKPRYKLFSQTALGVIIALFLYCNSSIEITAIAIPFLKSTFIYLGIMFIPFVIFMIVATSNAVNLTDGLDGLASGVISFVAFALVVLSYLKGNYILANRFNLVFIEQAGELTVFTSSLMGAILGFLWYNAYPAQIFMGDTGSLALGGILAMLAILLQEELFFVIVGAIFVAEAGSSLMQRYYFKYTRKKTGKGKRLFLRAPIHHHFELKGIKEQKIVVRFWIIAALLAAIGLATLKLR